MPVSARVLERLTENHRRFLSFIERRVGSREAAEDILQDAFVRGLEKGDTLRDEESAVAWFYRVLRNAIVDYYRRAAVERRVLGGAPGEVEVTAGFDEELERAACACVLAAAESLKPEYAEILRRVDTEGAAPEEFGRAHGLASGAARVRLHRARRALRREVERSCGTCAVHGCFDCTCRT